MDTRVVLDTNILISALGWGGKPERCLELVFEGEVDAYATQDMISELSRVLEYDRFDFSEDEKRSFLELVVAVLSFAESEIDIDVASDPDDNIFLECAVCVDADYIVSGDSDLLQLEDYDGVSILTAEEFLDKFDQ